MELEPTRSIGGILKDIAENIEDIVRSEVRLAKAEIREEAAKAKRGAILVTAGAVILALALVFVLLACAYLLALFVPHWAAALIVAGATAVIGAGCLASGLKKLQNVRVVPPKTAATIEENLQWAKSPGK